MATGRFGRGTIGRRVLIGAAAVLVLAAVIFGVAAVSEPARRRTGPVTSPTGESTALEATERTAKSAAQALASGETTRALDLAKKALAEDPDNTTAKRVIASTQQPAKSAGDTKEDPDGAAPAGAGAYASQVTDSTKLLPAVVRDWRRGRELIDKTEALVTFEPEPATDDADEAVRVLITSHDRGSEQKASAFIEQVSKKAYATAGKSVTVGVVPDGYSGADVSGQVVVAFARGRYAFEVVLAPVQGASFNDSRALALDIARRIPAAVR